MYPQFIDDPGLVNDEKLKPIQLPLSRLSGLVTAAPGAGAENPRPSGRVQKGPPEPARPSLAEMLQGLKLSERQELFFMQLPDCMPGGASAPGGNSSAAAAAAAGRRTVHSHGQVSSGGPGAACLSYFLTKLKVDIQPYGRRKSCSQ